MSETLKKTASIFTRVTPELKTQAEEVLNQLQIPMSTALNMFLQQVVNQRKIPFEVSTSKPPLNADNLTRAALDVEIQKGINNFINEDTLSDAEIKKEFNIKDSL